MAAELYWQVNGSGPDLVLVHGWGMNGAVWQQTAEVLAAHFRVHVVDLPGYGHSADQHADSLEAIAQRLTERAPKQAIWVGWSLGGLVATHMALHHSEYVAKLVTVASSPKFAAERPWRGIQPQVLSAFTDQLVDDFQTTIERFMALQAMGSTSARQDVKTLKQAVLSRPSPNPHSLLAGLQMLANVDLREQLPHISVPLLRLYGRLDGLVPVKVAHDLAQVVPDSQQYIFTESSHAPFMTEFDTFCQQLVAFAGQH
ncbi:pimeloyl-ACP methyl ester esterase BioH [Vibrio fluvialis]|uniref:pimeloyl-ACP methyl ester esterase BioH n=1 Tax=Vibrio fluvialis TaxID=676 RepID=UPI001F32EE31|nr:pimeloyl-ACP methyl ester esterase BioH [Vibrio fluvialis]MCE7612625.1 pimeloyl-ACP methyl ester esterase BioH [Vibrio fluvialis]MCE7618041.1 pimeloyl-ACP methyl ester esterase BioH [Vibrio fluvialis]MCE7628038.1 pimeloyl-ACP methyl ester esterase BioH [Vibrio fluvialis]